MNETLVILPEIYQRLNLTSEATAQFCEKWQIIELSLLSLLASVLLNGFRLNGNNPSDDVLHTKVPDACPGLWLLFGLDDGF